MICGKLIPCSTNDALLVVTEYQDGVMRGVLRHPRLNSSVKIRSLSELILKLDDLLDLDECLTRPLPLVKPIAEDSGIAVFRIQVLFREHCTWQGRLVWSDRNLEVSFRSVLELMQLIDELLGT